jgi:aspartate racemase
MKILGLIGGTSWVSTGDYYKLINQGINKRLGGLEFAECIIYSFNFGDIKRNNDANEWDKTFEMFKKAGLHLRASGAAGIVLCAATPHLMAARLEKEIAIPIIHIATATATSISAQGLKKVALLGTKFTMEQDFFKEKLREKAIEVMVPEADDREYIHTSIFEELGHGIVTAATKERYLSLINTLIKNGAEGIILGCTELPLVIQPADIPIPVFDTVEIHARAAVDFSLG